MLCESLSDNHYTPLVLALESLIIVLWSLIYPYHSLSIRSNFNTREVNTRETNSLSFIARSPGDEFAWQLSESNPTSVPELFIPKKPESEAVRVNL